MGQLPSLHYWLFNLKVWSQAKVKGFWCPLQACEWWTPPAWTWIISGVVGGHRADMLQLFHLAAGWKVRLWVRFKMMNSAVCEDKVWLVYELRVVQLWSVVSTHISLWVCPDPQPPSPSLHYHDKPAGRLWSLFWSNHQKPEVFRSDFSLAKGETRGEKNNWEKEKVHIPLLSSFHRAFQSTNAAKATDTADKKEDGCSANISVCYDV